MLNSEGNVVCEAGATVTEALIDSILADGTVKDVDYTKTEGGQKIMYEVNFNQSIQVNTEGNKIISYKFFNSFKNVLT